VNQAVREMLAQYKIKSVDEAQNALKEIIQEIALLGLHRANFFEKAAFYGGTALRILYQLPRYSEDLDFTLFKKKTNFSLKPYFSAVEKELESFGFQIHIEPIDKKNESNVESAFIKANTQMHFLKIEALKSFAQITQSNAKLKIKFEVDTEPVTNFEFETRYLLVPTSFPIISLKKPDLFAGKLHALLYRKWKNRIKGRDYYDFIWYLKNKIPVRLNYLREKAIQSGHAKPGDLQTTIQLKTALVDLFISTDFEGAKKDIRAFIRDESEIEVWSKDFFVQITDKIQVE